MLCGGGGRRVLAAEAVMFPIAFGPGSVAGRTLKADDITGITDLYPDADFARTSGSVSGRVTKEGQPIFGAHIVAFDVARGTSVGSFTPGRSSVRSSPISARGASRRVSGGHSSSIWRTSST